MRTWSGGPGAEGEAVVSEGGATRAWKPLDTGRHLAVYSAIVAHQVCDYVNQHGKNPWPDLMRGMVQVAKNLARLHEEVCEEDARTGHVKEPA